MDETVGQRNADVSEQIMKRNNLQLDDIALLIPHN